jgi:hypothetical protein
MTSPFCTRFSLAKFERSLCVEAVSSTTLTRQYREVSDAINVLSSGALGADVPTPSTVRV